MKRVFLAVAFATTMLCAPLAFADDACVEKNDKQFEDCIAKAKKLVNDIEIEDATAICNKVSADTRWACDQAEADAGGRGPEPAPEQQ